MVGFLVLYLQFPNTLAAYAYDHILFVLFFQLMYKKYCAGHKYHMGAYDKAQSGLKKHKKKTKAKYGYDQKEMQVSATWF